MKKHKPKVGDFIIQKSLGSNNFYKIKHKKNNGLFVCFNDADVILSYQHIINNLHISNYMNDKPHLKKFLMDNYIRVGKGYSELHHSATIFKLFPRKLRVQLEEELEKITKIRKFNTIIDEF